MNVGIKVSKSGLNILPRFISSRKVPLQGGCLLPYGSQVECIMLASRLHSLSISIVFHCVHYSQLRTVSPHFASPSQAFSHFFHSPWVLPLCLAQRSLFSAQLATPCTCMLSCGGHVCLCNSLARLWGFRGQRNSLRVSI